MLSMSIRRVTPRHRAALLCCGQAVGRRQAQQPGDTVHEARHHTAHGEALVGGHDAHPVGHRHQQTQGRSQQRASCRRPNLPGVGSNTLGLGIKIPLSKLTAHQPGSLQATAPLPPARLPALRGLQRCPAARRRRSRRRRRPPAAAWPRPSAPRSLCAAACGPAAAPPTLRLPALQAPRWSNR
jgi:hypothetical protein